MMKKVALLTFHDTTNFGALLQTFGLYKKLIDLGHSCTIIDYKCANIIKREVPQKFRFSFSPKMLTIEFLIQSKVRRRYATMHQFMKKNMPQMTCPYDRETISNIKEEFESYVVGSDMLWGLDITDSDYSYFLDFAPNGVTKFSYATSIGKREWTKEEQNKIANLLSRFKTISVREEITAERLKPVLAKECEVVCDPTMLLTAEEWKPYVSNRYSKGDYVLAYFDTDDGKAFKDAKWYAQKYKKRLLVINAMPSWLSKTHNVFPAKVEDFLSLIYYADTIFTASYHGMLFSLYFHKNFIYYNRQPSYRMETVAKRLGVLNREGRIADLENLEVLNYDIIDNRIEQYREFSLGFIKRTLC